MRGPSLALEEQEVETTGESCIQGEHISTVPGSGEGPSLVNAVETFTAIGVPSGDETIQKSSSSDPGGMIKSSLDAAR